jgi:hypothetical protein
MLPRVSVLILVVLLFGLVAIVAAQEGCVGEPECYEIPPEEAPVISNWPGDDRLNPVADEYYTVYCNYDLVRVYAGLPSPQEIGSLPIVQILAQPSPFDAGNGFTVSHIDDIVTISGSNGNGPLHPGSKSFSLQQCIERNGNPDIVLLIPAPYIVSTYTIEIQGVSCTIDVYSDGTARQICEREIGAPLPADAPASACLGLPTWEAIGRCLNERIAWNTPAAQVVRFIMQVICQVPLLSFVFLSVPGSRLIKRIRRNSKGAEAK